MVPIYCVCGWLGLYQKQYTEYYDLIRETYEAVVVYSFYRFLVVYIGGEDKLHGLLKEKQEKKERAEKHFGESGLETGKGDTKEKQEGGETVSEIALSDNVEAEQGKEGAPQKEWLHFGGHLGAMKFLLKEWHLVHQFRYYTKIGILQYVPIRIIWAFVGFILQYNEAFQKGVWSPKVGFPYYIIIVNISQVWAIYNLLLFYHTMYEEIKNIKPLGKFLSIKLMVFFVFWQQLILTACVRLRFIKQSQTYTVTEVADSLQDFIICLEMFVLAISHLTVWPAMEFHNPGHDQTAGLGQEQSIHRRRLERLGSVLSPADLVHDMYHMAKSLKEHGLKPHRGSTHHLDTKETVTTSVDLEPIPEPSKGDTDPSQPSVPNIASPTGTITEITDQDSQPVEQLDT